MAGTLSGTYRGTLDALSAPIDLLRRSPSPINFDGELWRRIVADAVWLLESGKAVDAIAGGWSTMELFGWSCSSWQSIAGWLGGSRNMMIGQAVDEQLHTKWACVRNDKGRRWLIRNVAAALPEDATLLWNLNHGNRRA